MPLPFSASLVRRCFAVLGVLIAVGAAAAPVRAETIARCGEGFLEEIDGYRVLHLRGTPYEMGYQHGALLSENCRENMRYLLEEKAAELTVELGGVEVTPRQLIGVIIETQMRHVPDWYVEELRGLADGAGVDPGEVMACNFIPELFHCSGFAVMNSATEDGTLYHGRVLDYAVDWHLQDHAVLIVAEPEGGVPFVNVTYAGFIGSVTGMNAEHVSIGEMGGGGLGHWDGVPMAVLVRQVLQEATTLDEAVAIFRDQPRTCEYFFVIADGDENRAVGMEASWDEFTTVYPGESHPLLPHAVPDAVLLSAGDRYEALVERVRAQHGALNAESARHLMDPPVCMGSNLHCVLFEPETTRLWVANAGPNGEQAALQPYAHFQLTELLERTPDTSAPEIELPEAPVAAAE